MKLKLLMATMTVMIVSILTAWAADPPQVKVRVIDLTNEQSKEDEKDSVGSAKEADVRGSIMIIGPGGVMHTQSFGQSGGATPDVKQMVEGSLKAAGVSLPENVRQTLEQAVQQQGQGVGKQPAGEAVDISSKLDRILERLEKIERDIAQLKAAQRD